MSKVIRLSDIMIGRLEDYRKYRIERANILVRCCNSYLEDIKRYEDMSYSELVEDAILSGYINAKTDVENLSKCLK